MAVVLVLAGCDLAGIKESIPPELSGVSDVSYSGDTITSKQDAIAAIQNASSEFYTVFTSPTQPLAMNLVSPKSFSKLFRATSEPSISGIDTYLANGFKGTVTLSQTDSNTSNEITMSVNASISLTTDHDLPLASNTVKLADLVMDETAPDLNVKLPISFYNFWNTKTNNGTINYPYSLAYNNNINGTIKIKGGVSIVSSNTNLALKKIAVNVDSNTTVNVTGLNLAIIINESPEFTFSGTLGAVSANTVTMQMVASQKGNVKGGKIVLSVTYNPNLQGLDLNQLVTAITNQDPSVLYNMLESNQSLSNVQINVKVYDNANKKVLDEVLTVQDIVAYQGA